MAPLYIGSGGNLVSVATGLPFSPFVPGATRPIYEPTVDYSGDKNVGSSVPIADMDVWSGAISGGVVTLTGSGTYEGIKFPGVLDVQGPVTIRDCAVEIPPTYIGADSVRAAVRVLQGSGNTGASFTRFEIHNRCQRPFNGITGRNFYLDRSVITGCLDAVSDTTGGSAPQNFAYEVTDSIIPALAFWYSDPQNAEVHNPDMGSHSDAFQKYTTLQGTVTNTVVLAHVDEIIGTGTPGSGRDAGGTYTPITGSDYTANQAQMEAWRASGTMMSTASQTYGGVSKRVPSTTLNGSYASAMINVDKLDLLGCFLDGGTVTINAASSALGSTIDMDIINNVFWNAMTNGHSGNPLTKGHAVLTRTGKNFSAFTGNKWFDDTSVSIVRF